MDFSRIEVLSFDCYGTLVDWESGILTAFAPVLAARGIKWDEDKILTTYAAAEAAVEAGPFLPYRQVLEEVARRVAAEAGFTATAAERAQLADSVPHWEPFPDTIDALRVLSKRFKLVIISNIEDALFAQTARKLRIQFPIVITAEQARAYKPSHAPFELALKKLGVATDRWAHAGASLFHDVGPANALGLASIYVNRRHEQDSGGASPRTTAVPALEVHDLAELARKATAAPSP